MAQLEHTIKLYRIFIVFSWLHCFVTHSLRPSTAVGRKDNRHLQNGCVAKQCKLKAVL